MPVVSASSLRTSACAPAADQSRDRWATWDARKLGTAFVQSTRVDKVWTDPKTPATGDGVTVGVIDTGIAGGISDFRDLRNRCDVARRRLGRDQPRRHDGDRPLRARHARRRHHRGQHASDSARPIHWPTVTTVRLPTAKLVSLKASDDHGNAYVSDVIAGAPVRRRPWRRLRHPRRQPLARSVARAAVSARSARRRGRGRMGPRRRRRGGRRQPRDRRRCRCVRTRE